MIKRHVFAADSLTAAEAVAKAARAAGIDRKSIMVEARSDIEVTRIADERKNVSMDFIPAAIRGTVLGGFAGLLGGLVAMFIPFFGVSPAGVVALGVVGALVGTWASALVGSSLPDEIRRAFADHIDAGKILLVIDSEAEDFSSVERALVSAGGVRLPYEA